MSASELPSGLSPSLSSATPPEGHGLSDGGLDEPPMGQLLLGTDKRNPVFAVYEDEAGERLLVFYGFEIIEIVQNDPQTPAYKLLLGRLYNSGVKLTALCESFQAAPKTIRRWGAALLQGDPRELIRVLEGRSACRKRTVEVERFARLRWPEIVAERSYGAVGRLQQEIQGVFGVKISRSGLQPLIGELKARSAPPTSPLPANEPALEGAVRPAEPTPAPPEPEIEKGATGRHCVSDAALITALTPTVSAPVPGNIVHPSAFFPKDPAGANYWCDHAGVLLFAPALASVANVSANAHPILAQWLSALWLGAHNIEQTKFLNWEDLALVLGGVVRFPTPQRDQLKLLAEDADVIDGLWRFNLQNLGPAVGSDFYLDPHTKHYTGEQNVLKGWCPKIRFADKVMHSDFIHTARGEPLYFETTDNFSDLRQRFFGVIERARKVLQWPPERVLTLVVDRGIYGAECFEKVIADPHLHLITWQKGFGAQAWDPGKVMGTTTITRVRNSSTDLRSYRFAYVEGAWAQNSKLRQIVVQATDYKGRVIQVAILTDDLERSAGEIIRLMFQRWLQENDFKYLDKHFGINEITSYRSIAYEELKGQVEDREVKSAARKALDLKQKQEFAQIKRHLLAEEQALQAHQRRAQKRQPLEAQLAQEGVENTPPYRALNRELVAIKTADQRYENVRAKRRELIDQSHQRTGQIQTQIQETAAQESRLEAMIAHQMVRLDSQGKQLLDILRISARNLFYQALQPFKQAYDNYRDDHDHFRKLTHSPGVLEVSAQQIVIHLLPRTNYGSGLRRVINQTLEAINAKATAHPCLPGKKLIFRLAQRAEMEVKINVGR